MQQKEHLKLIRPIKKTDPLLSHLKHEEGFYGVFINDLDNYVYIGYAKDLLNTCKDLLVKSRNPGTRIMSGYMNKFAFTFDKLPLKPLQIEKDRWNNLLELIYQYKTYPVQFNGHGFNFINPVTGRKFKK